MRTVSLIFCVLVAIAVTGCDRAERISKDALIEKTHHWKEPKVAIWYYTGSRNGRDYFRHYDLGASELYSVESGQISLPQALPVTKDEQKWIIMKWGPIALRNDKSR
jgi:hypothetical protein